MIVLIQLLLILFVQSNEIYEIQNNNHLILKQNVEYDIHNEYEWSSYKNIIEKITIEDSVTEIPFGAFHNFKILKQIKFSKNLEKIGDYSFQNCGLIYVDLSETKVNLIGEKAFENNKNLKQIKLSETITQIGNNVFSKCRKLENIVLPNSLTEIGKNVFDSCSNLEKIKIGKGIENIEANMFYNCYKLKEIEISEENEKLKTIENVIFDKNNENLLFYPIGLENIKYKIPN